MKPKYRPPVTIYRGHGEPLTPGACPHCRQPVSITRTGKRRKHNDNGLMCPGSNMLVAPRLLEIDPEIIRAALPPTGPVVLAGKRTTALRRPSTSTAEKKQRPLGANSDRCTECGRGVQINLDGTLRAHRPSADMFAGPYCPGGREKGRQ